MINYFSCKVCDKSIKIKSKKKHLSSINHKSLSMSVVNRYSITNPDYLQIENILKNYVLEYNKKVSFHLIICKWKLRFSDSIVSVKSNTWYSVSGGYYLRDFVLSKIKYFQSYGRKFSHISEMNITFITDLRNMTYEYYLTQPKPMVEWRLNAILAKNPELIRIFENTSRAIIRNYQFINEEKEEN